MHRGQQHAIYSYRVEIVYTLFTAIWVTWFNCEADYIEMQRPLAAWWLEFGHLKLDHEWAITYSDLCVK